MKRKLNKRKLFVWCLLGIVAFPPLSLVWRLISLAREDDRHAAHLENATRVDTFRVSRSGYSETVALNPERDNIIRRAGNAGTGERASERIAEWEIVKHGRTQDAAFARQIAALLTPQVRERRYFDIGMKGCEFNPGVALRFWTDGQPLDVLLCLGCEDLLFVEAGTAHGHDFSRHKDKPKAFRAKLYKLLRQAFPGDQDLERFFRNRLGS